MERERDHAMNGVGRVLSVGKQRGLRIAVPVYTESKDSLRNIGYDPPRALGDERPYSPLIAHLVPPFITGNRPPILPRTAVTGEGMISSMKMPHAFPLTMSVTVVEEISKCLAISH